MAMYRRVGSNLIYNVTNKDLLPLYEGNEAYELVEEAKPVEVKAEKPKKTTKK